MASMKFPFDELGADSEIYVNNMNESHSQLRDSANTVDDYTTEADIEKIRKQAFEEGKKVAIDEHRQALIEAEQLRTKNLENLNHKLEHIGTSMAKIRADLTQDCVALIMTMANKLVGLGNHLMTEKQILDFIQDNIHLVLEEPCLEITVHTDIKNLINDKAEKVFTDNNFQGKLQIIESRAINPGDCEIKWNYGSIKKDSELLLHKLNNIFKEYLDSNQVSEYDTADRDTDTINDNGIVSHTNYKAANKR